MLSNAEFRNYHEREAARLRSLLSVATTAALRTRLLEQAEAHERLAAGSGGSGGWCRESGSRKFSGQPAGVRLVATSNARPRPDTAFSTGNTTRTAARPIPATSDHGAARPDTGAPT
jgi:hypothetical protein